MGSSAAHASGRRLLLQKALDTNPENATKPLNATQKTLRRNSMVHARVDRDTSRRVSPAGLGTMRTDNATFVVLLIGVIVLVGALTFFPALLLGPIVQALTGHLY